MLVPEPATMASARFLSTVPHAVARRHLALGVHERDGRMLVRHAPGLAPLDLANLARWCGVPIDAHTAPAEQVAREIDAAYVQHEGARARANLEAGAQTGAGAARATGGATEGVPLIVLNSASADSASIEADLASTAVAQDADLLSTDRKGPVVRLVDALLFEAIGRGASDVHIQPLSAEVLIRYRVDGVLATARSVPVTLAAAIVTRIKVMARLDVAERRAPQDGRATVVIGAGRAPAPAADGTTTRPIDLRISTLPTAFGERVVLRLLYTEQAETRATIDALRMPADVQRDYLERAARSNGLLLVTGPTGSGKTTTLYATLRWIVERSVALGRDRADVNIMTIEDPVEYDLSAAQPGDARPLPISQTQVDARKNLSFAAGLRHILRQDPDVIMVGEIRDAETARVAIQSSLTGHLVFSTLHTNDAPSAVSRLIDLEIEPFLICSSLSAVLAQRLLRLTHQPCTGAGCPACLHTGFKGRRGIFELLTPDDHLRQAIMRRAGSTELRDLAVARGLRPLSAHGESLVAQGLTSAAEVQRVTLGVE